MQCVDQYRGAAGFILMAATNFYEGLDEALVRDMRFDEKIRVDTAPARRRGHRSLQPSCPRGCGRRSQSSPSRAVRRDGALLSSRA